MLIPFGQVGYDAGFKSLLGVAAVKKGESFLYKGLESFCSIVANSRSGLNICFRMPTNIHRGVENWRVSRKICSTDPSGNVTLPSLWKFSARLLLDLLVVQQIRHCPQLLVGSLRPRLDRLAPLQRHRGQLLQFLRPLPLQCFQGRWMAERLLYSCTFGLYSDLGILNSRILSPVTSFGLSRIVRITL